MSNENLDTIPTPRTDAIYAQHHTDVTDAFLAHRKHANRLEREAYLLKRRCERLEKTQAVCHCGDPLLSHGADGHSPVEMREECPFERDLAKANARVAELTRRLKPFAMRFSFTKYEGATAGTLLPITVPYGELLSAHNAIFGLKQVVEPEASDIEIGATTSGKVCITMLDGHTIHIDNDWAKRLRTTLDRAIEAAEGSQK